MQFKLGKIENVLVNGDTATADVTLIIDTGGQFTYTADPSQFTLVKEDGQWKDCTPLDE
jgi:predicted Rdx family selenoprotein